LIFLFEFLDIKTDASSGDPLFLAWIVRIDGVRSSVDRKVTMGRDMEEWGHYLVLQNWHSEMENESPGDMTKSIFPGENYCCKEIQINAHGARL
jgi:hypothetical protein